MKKKADMKKNETERCIEDLKKVMDSHPGLSNAQIQYIDRWLLSTYIKPEPKVYY